MKFLILFLLSTTTFAAQAPIPKQIIEKLDTWGTCYSGYNCQGGVMRNGVTGTECRQIGGHSLYMSNADRCFSF